MKEYFDEQINKRIDELDNFEDILCIGKLTLASYSSAARSQMFTQHLIQSWIPNNPEIPKVSTGYEHMFGYYSGSEYITDSKLEVIKKISKYDDYIYTLIVYNKKKNEYDVITRNEVKKLSESHGYIINNKSIDSYNEGDVINKNTKLFNSPSTDEYGNFMYGLNAKVIYTISPETIEDAVVVSESFAKRFSVTNVETCTVPINDNDIPLNLYGTKKHYKSFPDIGEYTKRSILCGTRRRDKLYDQYNLKNSNLKRTFSSDSIYQFMGDWKVVDIDLWSNKPIDEIPDLPAYSQVKKYFLKINNYWNEIYTSLDKIINNNECKYTQRLSQLYAKARDYLDPNSRYVHEDKMFSNIIMEFTIMKSEPLRKGCKLCGRFGNKSVISNILPDSEMGITSDGVVPDIRMDALGVLGRLNTGQCLEQELNWIADKVLKIIKSMGDPTDNPELADKQIDYLLEFINRINKEQYEEMNDFLNNLTNDEREEFILDIINGKDPIYIQQSPIYCVTGDDLYNLYNDYEMEKSELYFKNVNGSSYKTLRNVIVADEYIMRLKQEPITKYSARSASLINPTSFLPIKSLNNKKHKTLFQDQANRIGEQELHILMLSNDADALDYFYRSYASSVTGRRDTTLYTQDPTNGFEINMKSERSKVIDKLNALIGSVGYELVIKYDDEYDEEEDNSSIDESYDPQIEKYPKYLKEKEYNE